VKSRLEKLQALGCNVNFKLHFLHSYFYYFPENLVLLSEEHERDPIRISKRWKEGMTVDEMSSRWSTTFGA
jgi:hypothetical protein